MRLAKLLSVVQHSARLVVRTLQNVMFKLLPYTPHRMTQEEYESLYASGDLDHYKSVNELGRFSVIVGYCAYFKPSGAILDLGCGEGILQERLNSYPYSCYVGVDFSQAAISRASSWQDDKTHFVVADVSASMLNEKFDIIIFNECLYHFEDPLRIVQEYEKCLHDDGLFIISICDHEKTKPVWKMLEAVYFLQDSVRIVHQSKLSWTVKVFMPSRQ